MKIITLVLVLLTCVLAAFVGLLLAPGFPMTRQSRRGRRPLA